MAFLNKKTATHIKADDLKREVVDVPEWGKGLQVIIGELSAEERVDYGNWSPPEGSHGIAATLAHWFIINEDGSRPFTQDDWRQLAKGSHATLDRLFEAVKRVNLIGSALTDAEKN